MARQANSLSHTKRMREYRIVFAPEHRGETIYGQYRASVGEIMRRLCPYRGVEVIEGHLMPDHAHTLASIPPKMSVSSFSWGI